MWLSTEHLLLVVIVDSHGISCKSHPFHNFWLIVAARSTQDPLLLCEAEPDATALDWVGSTCLMCNIPLGFVWSFPFWFHVLFWFEAVCIHAMFFACEVLDPVWFCVEMKVSAPRSLRPGHNVGCFGAELIVFLCWSVPAWVGQCVFGEFADCVCVKKIDGKGLKASYRLIVAVTWAVEYRLS